MDLALHKRRLIIALSITGACFLLAVAAMVGGIVSGREWLSLVAVGAVVPGLGAQIWFIVGIVREKSAP